MLICKSNRSRALSELGNVILMYMHMPFAVFVSIVISIAAFVSLDYIHRHMENV